MFQWVLAVIDQGGYLGIFLLMLLENVFPPIPSELIMPTGGLLAKQGKLSLAGVMVAGTLGSFAGQTLLYWVGARIGEERLMRWARKHGHWVAVSPEELSRTKAWFRRRRGGVAVCLGRLVPAIRSLISIPAGLVRMPLPSFLLCTLLGGTLWNIGLVAAGGWIAQNYDKVEAFLDPVSYAIVGFLVGSYLWRLVKQSRKADVEENL